MNRYRNAVLTQIVIISLEDSMTMKYHLNRVYRFVASQPNCKTTLEDVDMFVVTWLVKYG